MAGRLSFLGVRLVVLLLLAFPAGILAETRYTVKSGDTLYTIAKQYGISVEALREANGLSGSLLRPKQVLLIPSPQKGPSGNGLRKTTWEPEVYVVKQGESLHSISKKTGLSIEEIKRLNRLQTSALKVGQRLILSERRGSQAEELEELGDVSESSDSPVTEAEGFKDSEPLGKWRSPEERNLFIRVVKTFLGVPYRLGGSTIKGMDCSAFVKKIFEIFNVHLPRTAREQLSIGKKVGREELEEGDLLFFRTRRANNIHVGIYIGNNEFIHASYRSKEVRVDSLDLPYFRQRFLNGVRVIELEQES
ncbi:MAG: LysM peptidoglycan-binding domain-containing protein [Desulfobacterota bacterium]|nr:LysM peptidoglycan-binding domain-containing protein [Thermodesulfobacteriota bacterium]